MAIELGGGDRPGETLTAREKKLTGLSSLRDAGVTAEARKTPEVQLPSPPPVSDTGPEAELQKAYGAALTWVDRLLELQSGAPTETARLRRVRTELKALREGKRVGRPLLTEPEPVVAPIRAGIPEFEFPQTEVIDRF